VSDDFHVVRTQSLLESYVFGVERRTVRHGDAEFDRDVATHRGAVAVLALDPEERVGLLRQYRAPFDRFVLEVPAGTLDVDGEDPLTAAQRELTEELGATSSHWTHLGSFLVSPGWTDQVMHIYEARDVVVGERRPEGPEETSSQVLWLSRDELRAALRDEGVVDSTLALSLHRIYGRFFDSE
jgi:8-oxo-dGDP phosphatase